MPEAGDATASIDDFVTVDVPRSSMVGIGEVEVRDAPDVPPIDSEWVDAGDAVEVELVGAELAGDATITFDVGQPPPAFEGIDAEPVALTLDEPSGVWVRQEAAYDKGSATLTIVTDHFSLWRFAWPSEGLVDAIESVVGAISSTDSNSPSCEAEEEARRSWKVRSDDGDRIEWCFGLTHDEPILRVVNSRLYPVVLTYDSSSFFEYDTQDVDISVTALYGTLLAAAGTEADIQQVALSPGTELALGMESNTEKAPRVVRTEWDGLAMAAEALDIWWQTVLMMAGQEADAEGSVDTLVSFLETGDCARRWLAGSDGIATATDTEEAFEAVYGFVRECGPDVVDQLQGPRPSIAVIGWFTNTLVSGIRQLVGDAQAAGEILAADGAAARYEISIERVSGGAGTGCDKGLGAKNACEWLAAMAMGDRSLLRTDRERGDFDEGLVTGAGATENMRGWSWEIEECETYDSGLTECLTTLHYADGTDDRRWIILSADRGGGLLEVLGFAM